MLFDASRFTFHASRLVLLAVLLSRLSAAHGQVRSNPVHQGTGPLSDLSTNVGAGSGPVHERGRSVRDGSLGTLSGNAVRDGGRGGMLSGPVSDISAGPVTSGQPVSGGGTMTDAGAGAVKKDANSPLGERISQPVRELGPLLDQLRALQPGSSEPAEEAAPELQAGQEEGVPEAPIAADQAADNEEPAAAESEAAAPDVAAEVEAAAPQEEVEEPAPDAEAEAPPDQDNGAPPAVEDDPRDAAEPTPAPGTH
jgi:hypothetical protein